MTRGNNTNSHPVPECLLEQLGAEAAARTGHQERVQHQSPFAKGQERGLVQVKARPDHPSRHLHLQANEETVGLVDPEQGPEQLALSR